MEKIKSRIEKLLRLSLSNSPHEAKAASLKAIELMEKYRLTRGDISDQRIVSNTIHLQYYRVPQWLSELFARIGYMNGCYVVWINGSELRHEHAKIVITGQPSDILNIEYYMRIFQTEIEKKVKHFKQHHPSSRENTKSYRMGLVEGIVSTLYSASQTFNATLSDNALVPVDYKYAEAEAFYVSHHKVKMMSISRINSRFYRQGKRDSREINVTRPIGEQTIQACLEFH